MVSSAIAGSSRITSADVNMYATNVKAGKVNSFSDVMAKSLPDNSSVNNKNSYEVQSSKVDRSTDTEQAEPVKETETQVVDNTDDATTNQKEEVVAEVSEAGKDILEKIQEELNVSEEELTECMEVLGLTLADLLQPGNILKLVMEVTGTQDAMVIVTDADLSGALKNILDYAGARINELAEQLDMTPDELQSMLESADMQALAEDSGVVFEKSAEENVESKSDVVSEEPVYEESPETVEDVIVSKLTVNTSKDASNSAMNGESKGQQSMDANSKGEVKADVNTLGEAVSQISQSFEAVLNADVEGVSQVDVVRQVVDSIKLNNTRMMQSIEIQLNPENLGKVNVMVSVREGVITAQIATENEQVKRAIESQMNTLKETFEAQGIKVEAVEVTVQSHAFESNQSFEGDKEQGDATSKAKRKINLDGLNFDDEVEETAEEVVSVHENSSVEYLA